MRFIFSIIGFALFIVGCQNLVPQNYKYGTLPTHEYGAATASESKSSGALATIRKVCLNSHGIVHLKGNTITCTLEGEK